VSCPASQTYTGAAIDTCTVAVTGANLSLAPAPSYANNVNVGTATASYSFAGDETYVRAKILESNGRMAWTQPVMR